MSMVFPQSQELRPVEQERVEEGGKEHQSYIDTPMKEDTIPLIDKCCKREESQCIQHSERTPHFESLN